MKTALMLIFGLLTLLLVSITPGCDLFNNTPEEGEGVAALDFSAPRAQLIQAGPETMTNADTITVELGTFYSPIEYEIAYVADSLSGSTAGTQYLEWDADGDGANFVRRETMVINGVTTRGVETGTIVGGTLRLRTITTGTQSTRLWHEFWYTPRAPN